MMGRHRRTVNRWGMPDDHMISASRCNNCGSTEPVAWYCGSIPVCAKCYDRWQRNRYRRPAMSENQRADMILDAWADAGTGPQEEAY